MNHGFISDEVALDHYAPRAYIYSHPETRMKVLGYLSLAERMGFSRREAMLRIVRKNRWWLDHDTVQQRKWQTNVSRRPARGRHHDSWAIREKYVRWNPTKGM